MHTSQPQPGPSPWDHFSSLPHGNQDPAAVGALLTVLSCRRAAITGMPRACLGLQEALSACSSLAVTCGHACLVIRV